MYFTFGNNAGTNGFPVKAQRFAAMLGDRILYRHGVREKGVDVDFSGGGSVTRSHRERRSFGE
jgi:hypothetical protein